MSCNLPLIPWPSLSGIILMMGGISVGLTLAYNSPTSKEIQPYFGFSDMTMSLFNVAAFICCLPGGLIIHIIAQYWGKRVCAAISAFVGILGYILLAISDNSIMLFVMRCLTGLSVGGYSTIIPPYLIDVAPPDRHALFGFLNQIGLSLGYLLINLIGLYVPWRTLTFICAIPSVICFICIFFVPQITTNSEKPKASFFTVFKYPKDLSLAVALGFFLQFSGVNAILSNLAEVVDKAQIPISTKLVANLANGAQILATIIAAFLVDRVGHKKCWIISAIIQLISFILLCCQQNIPMDGTWFVVGLFLEQLGYGIGTGPIPFNLAAQIFLIEVQTSGMAITSGTNFIMGAIVVFIWPLLRKALGLGYAFIFFAGIQVLSILFGFIFIRKPEPRVAERSDEEPSDKDEPLSRRPSHAPDLAGPPPESL